ncbi:unnamed protein product [Symbiodinium natans]|uniref:Uncharacterized protein n=1 Tax=Symbiodinium natans TaxID=878477 RepID=A0A812Q381_9DINO|nr:unnamed protein product [Symbiodinium natans]
MLKGSAVPDEDEADRDIVVIRYAKGKPECTLELQVLSRLALVPDAGDHVPRVWGACEQGRDLIVVQERAVFGSLKAVVTAGLAAEQGLHAAAQAESKFQLTNLLPNCFAVFLRSHGTPNAEIARGMDCLQRARVATALEEHGNVSAAVVLFIACLWRALRVACQRPGRIIDSRCSFVYGEFRWSREFAEPQ